MDENSLIKNLSPEELKEYRKHRNALNKALSPEEAKAHYEKAKAILTRKKTFKP
ncbi:hypothetical protein [Oceanobacillus salinisoli]|uniref:hypothetical protein n=1 Tax=Oceanobacillus salinisoli TaxID=2678611 RepID=UPI0012E31AC4|nr:hypothetical protein [Oceanobacillus salinisoli]